jgi:serine/threonine protein kinase
MKRFKAVDFSLNPNMRKQIDQEVDILKLIEHENLVKFFELLVVKSEEHFEHIFILTEYYEVSNLISFLKKSKKTSIIIRSNKTKIVFRLLHKIR